MLLLVSSLKLIAEIALMAIAAQWVLGLLAGAKRDNNIFYGVLRVITSPFIKGMRLITPRLVIDRHIPLAVFVLLSMVWVIVTLAKINLCLQVGIQACQ